MNLAEDLEQDKEERQGLFWKKLRTAGSIIEKHRGSLAKILANRYVLILALDLRLDGQEGLAWPAGQNRAEHSGAMAGAGGARRIRSTDHH